MYKLGGFRTPEGDILTLGRPAASPWMWESWSTSKGAAFGPTTRGPFPLCKGLDTAAITPEPACLA